MGPGSPPAADNDDDDDDDDGTSSSSDDDNSPGMGGGGNDDADYENLKVGSDVKDLFEHIGRYQPHQIELEAVLKPFIPDFIPGIGDADAFIKVPRPDGQESSLGLTILDEPTAVQSDPGVLELQLRAASKMTNVKAATVRSVEAADKNPAALTKWMESVAEIQRTRPQPSVTYTHEVPTMEALMQAWPPQMEAVLNEVTLPTAMIDLSLVDFCKSLCALLDIPVHNNKLVESMHVLFTLFSEFKANQHFAAYGGANATHTTRTHTHRLRPAALPSWSPRQVNVPPRPAALIRFLLRGGLAGEEAIEAQAAAAGGAFAPKHELMRTGAQGFGVDYSGVDASAAMHFGEPLGNAFG